MGPRTRSQSVSQSVSVYSCTSTRKQEKPTFGMYTVYQVRYIGRPRKSETLTESWPPYFTYFYFYEVVHSISF